MRGFWTSKLQVGFNYSIAESGVKHVVETSFAAAFCTKRHEILYIDWPFNFAEQHRMNFATDLYPLNIPKQSQRLFVSAKPECRTPPPTLSTSADPQHATDAMAIHLKAVFSNEQHMEIQFSNITIPSLPFTIDYPITTDDIASANHHLPVKKASIVGHLRIDMLKLI